MEIENSVKVDFFSKTEAQDYINSKLDLKDDKVTGYGLSKNNFTDAYKDTLDNLDLNDVVRDPLYCRTENRQFDQRCEVYWIIWYKSWIRCL